MKKYKIGYTQGTFDLFHVGHLNLIKRSKELCDYLIVGVNSDELVKEYKNRTPIIHDTDRLAIVEALKYVDEAFISTTLDKKVSYDKYSFNAIFIADCWENDKRWQDTKKEMNMLGVDVIFLPYTKGISSTLIRKELQDDKN